MTEFIGNSLQDEVWLADMRASKPSPTTKWQLRCKSDVHYNSTLLFTNSCENIALVMKNPKS